MESEEVIYTTLYKSPLGELILGSFNDRLCLCDWKNRKMRNVVDERIKWGLKAEFKEGMSTVLHETIKQLNEYFARERKEFSIPLLLVGTEFQKQVWHMLQNIPYGKTDTYLGLAKQLANEGAVRAVGAANGANAISIIVPCHRIIGSNGELTGYAGGNAAKKKLLSLEGYSPGGQIMLDF